MKIVHKCNANYPEGWDIAYPTNGRERKLVKEKEYYTDRWEIPNWDEISLVAFIAWMLYSLEYDYEGEDEDQWELDYADAQLRNWAKREESGWPSTCPFSAPSNLVLFKVAKVLSGSKKYFNIIPKHFKIEVRDDRHFEKKHFLVSTNGKADSLQQLKSIYTFFKRGKIGKGWKEVK